MAPQSRLTTTAPCARASSANAESSAGFPIPAMPYTATTRRRSRSARSSRTARSAWRPTTAVALNYAASTFQCTPAALAQPGGVALGAQAGPAVVRQLAGDADFSRFRQGGHRGRSVRPGEPAGPAGHPARRLGSVGRGLVLVVAGRLFGLGLIIFARVMRVSAGMRADLEGTV